MIKESVIELESFLLMIEVLSYRQVSEILLLDEETIRRSVKDYIEQNSLEPKIKAVKAFSVPVVTRSYLSLKRKSDHDSLIDKITLSPEEKAA